MTQDRRHRRITAASAPRLTAAALVAALGLASLVACAPTPPQPDSMRDPQADFAAFHTFGWQEPAGQDVDEPVKLLDGNLRAAIAAELQRRGYVPAPAGATPDLRIAYQTASADKIENNPVRVGVGMGSWGGSFGGSINVGSPSIRNYKEGTLVIHAIDTARNAEVWQGRVSGKITKGSLEPAAIARGVAVAMQDFPEKK